MRKRQDLDSRIKMVLELEQTIADNSELIEMGEMEGDQGIVKEAEKALFAMQPRVAEVEIETLLSGRGRWQRHLSADQCRGWRHRKPGLGLDADAHVFALRQ